MGNYFQKPTSTPFLCQKCVEFFQRPDQGPLICEECSLLQKFKKLEPGDKYEVVVTSIIFPMYTFIKNKTTFFNVKMGWYESPKHITEQIKPFRESNPIFRKKYKLIKRMIHYLHEINYLNNFKGIYIHSMTSNDILFVHDVDIKDKDRIIHLDIDAVIKKINQKK